MPILHNRKNKEILKKKLQEESFKRITLSFYRYVHIDDVQTFRDSLYLKWSDLKIFGRTYVASEGINAQISVPEHNWQAFLNHMKSHKELHDIPLKIAIEDDGKSFYKLIVRVKKQIVADGLHENEYDVTKVGNHLTAEKWNEAMDDPDTIIVDMRNHYESEVGHFENAICPDADTFKDELPMVKETLKGKKEKKVLLYCTGGIRCEKTSAYLKHHGFKDVNQLHGGIIDYKRQIERSNLPCRFQGKNFVFDERRGERITDDIVSECHQCGGPCDEHVNCENDACHLLFIQCNDCKKKYDGCCTSKCQKTIHLSPEEQKKLRKGTSNAPGVYKSRLRPKLKDIIYSKGHTE